MPRVTPPVPGRAASWIDRHGRDLLRWSLAAIFLWFGALKPLGLSPAADLIGRTLAWMPGDVAVPLVGWLEIAIGVGLLVPGLLGPALALLAIQLPGTFLPLVLAPDVCFSAFPYGLTLEGQFIVKNLTLAAAALVVAAGARRPLPGR